MEGVIIYKNPDLNNLLIDYCQIHNIVKFNDKSQHVYIHKEVNKYTKNFNNAHYASFYIKNNNVLICCHYIKTYTKDIHVDNEMAFRFSCINGHLHVVKFLLSLNQGIDVHIIREFVFRWSCLNGHLELVKFLWSLNLNINIHINNEETLKFSCAFCHIDVVKFLITLYKQENNTAYIEILNKYPKIKI